jgi:hypothetical protein
LALTPFLTNAIKCLDNYEFSEKIFRSHDGREKIFKVMKARANGIICSGMMVKYLFGIFRVKIFTLCIKYAVQ